MMKRDIINFILGVLLCGPAAHAQTTSQNSPSYRQVHVFFNNYCLACHNEADAKGGLILESFASLELGGDNGSVLEPGKADESRLVRVLLGKAEPKMPPKDAPQPKPEEIAVLAAWIDAGAKGPDPGSEPTRADKPPMPPALPSVPVQVPVVSEVGAVAWSPDGKRLAAGRHDEVLLFEGSLEKGESASAKNGSSGSEGKGGQAAQGTREPVHRLTGHAGKIASLAFSPDGGRLAVAGGAPGRFGEVRIWNVADGSLVQTIRGHDDTLYAVRWSADGEQLITCSYDRLVKVWDAESGAERATLKEHTDAVFDLDLSPDGRWLATASGDRTIKLWDLASGRRRYTLSESLGAVYAVAFRGDGRQLAAGGADKTIRLWDLGEQGPRLARSGFAHDGAVLDLAYASDGRSLFSTGEDRIVKRWSVESLSEAQTFQEQPDWVLSLSLSPDGQQLAVGRYDGSLALLDTANGAPLVELLASAPVADKTNEATTATARTEETQGGAPSWKPAELSSLSPRGAVRGETVRMTLTGTNLADGFAVSFSDSRITATIIAPEESSKDSNRLEADVSLPSELEPGLYSVLVQTPFGTTGSKPFDVGILPVSAERENGDDPEMPQPTALPSTLVGVIDRPGDNDLWNFDVTAGETIVFEVTAASLGSQLVAQLSVVDAEGNVLAESRPTEDRRDPVLAWKCPESGNYLLRVSDLEYGGGGGFFYRINAGTFPYVAGAFPLAIERGTSAEIALSGFNLPDGETGTAVVSVAPEAGDRVSIPLPGRRVTYSGQRQMMVTDSPVTLEVEPNDAVATASVYRVPFDASGRIASHTDDSTPDADLFGFEAAEGDRLALEVTARRLGSRLDSYLEVLDASGRPVALATARPTAQTEVALRDHSSLGEGLRIVSWTDLAVGDRVMVGGELLEVLALPRGPDDNIRFRNFRGQRLGLLGTTPEAHARGEAVYKVQLHQPGQSFPPNGMPVFELTVANDDGGPGYESDSYFLFNAPVTGTYYVRLTDVRDRGGDEYIYHVSVRPPKPDYQLTFVPAPLNVPRGGSIPLEVTAERRDGFEGPIAVRMEGLPEGFSATEGVIHAGEFSTTLTLSAEVDAQQPGVAGDAAGEGRSLKHADKTSLERERGVVTARRSLPVAASTEVLLEPPRVVGVAEIGTGSLERTTSGDPRLTLLPQPDIRVRVEPTEVIARPGDEVTFTAHVERLGGFGNRVPVNVRTLRHGSRVLNVGLNGVLVREGESTRQFSVKVEPWMPPGAFQFFAVGTVENAGLNEHASPPVVVRVETRESASEK